jgi:pimeloyl-ACP methyl ester carboxylesterase
LFRPHFSESLLRFSGLRMHWLDEGPSHPDNTFLCLHGQPTWSYLYRRMIPAFVGAGNRVVAPDFFVSIFSLQSSQKPPLGSLWED